MVRPVCIIVNPRRLHGRWRRYFDSCVAVLGKQADTWTSDHAGHAQELAVRAANADYQTIVAAGGDGTVHEVANGLLSVPSAATALGILPLGSGNDYAANLGLPRTPHEICQLLLGRDEWLVDVGLVQTDLGQSRYFLNTLGVGLNGAVVWERASIRWLHGLPLYGAAALKAIAWHFHALPTTLTIDDRLVEVATMFLAVALGRREGGGFRVAPEASLDDGWFDYLHAARITRLRALRYLPRLALGDIPKHDPAIRQGRCQRLVVAGTVAMPIHVDGEALTQPGGDVRRVAIALQPQRLRLRAVKPKDG